MKREDGAPDSPTSSGTKQPDPVLPPLSHAATEELGDVRRRLQNAKKMHASKSVLLSQCAPQLEENRQLVESDGKSLGRLTPSVAIRDDESSIIAAASSSRIVSGRLIDDGGDDDDDDEAAIEDLQQLYGDGKPILRRAGLPLEDFLHDWDERRQRDLRAQQAASAAAAAAAATVEPTLNGAEPSPPPLQDQSTAGGKSAAGKKKASAAGGPAKQRKTAGSKKATSGPIPSAFSKRYPLGNVPLYAPASGEGGTAALAIGPRQLDVQALPSRAPPPVIYNSYLYSTVLDIHDQAAAQNNRQLLGDLASRPPVLLRAAYVREFGVVQAESPEDECVLGAQCFARRLFHPNHPQNHFTARRWRDPDRPKAPTPLCYLDILLLYNYAKDRAKGSTAPAYQPPWTYLIGVPGEYQRIAFRDVVDGNNEGNTRPMRNIMATQFKPSTFSPSPGKVLCRFVEASSLLVAYGTRPVSSLAFVNPTSSVQFEVSTMTTERTLLLYVMRTLANQCARVLKQPLPEELLVCRLAFAPFEVAMDCYRDKAFRQAYLPADFSTNVAYITKHFDMIRRLSEDNLGGDRLGLVYPKPEGHVVYWLLHVRLNAATELVERIAQLHAHMRSAPASARAAKQQQQVPPPAASGVTPIPPPRTASDQPNPPPPPPLPPCLTISTMPDDTPEAFARLDMQNLDKELAAERTNIESKVRDYVTSHRRLVSALKKRMLDNLKGARFDDDELLKPEVWAEIKPSSSYIGSSSFFPEDRKYVEFTKRPRVETGPGPGQISRSLLARWCAPFKGDAVSHAVSCLASGCSDTVIWTTGEGQELPQDPPLSLPSAVFFAFPNDVPGRLGLRRVLDLRVLFGDFRALVSWVRKEADEGHLHDLYQQCGAFEKHGWDYSSYHPAAAAAIRNGSWRAHYSILMSLLLVVHCASMLAAVLSRIRAARTERFSEHLESLDSAWYATWQEAMLKPEAFKDPLSYRPDLSGHPRSGRMDKLGTSMRALSECIYQLHRFVFSHLPLAHAMVALCSDKDGPGPTDEALTSHKHSPVPDECGRVRPTLYEMYEPTVAGENVMCEDNLIDLSAMEGHLRFIADQSIHEPLLDGQQKGMPVRCHTRDWNRRTVNIRFYNRAFLRYCLQCLLCSSLGGYRSSRTVLGFERALEMYVKLHDLDKIDYAAMNIFLRKHKNIAIGSLRENVVFHIDNNPAFKLAIRTSFPDYDRFAHEWLVNCMDSFRQLLDQGEPFDKIDSHLRSSYGSNTPYVYRRLKADFFRYVWNRLREVLCHRMVKAFMDKDVFVWPDTLTLTPDSLRNLVNYVAANYPPRFSDGSSAANDDLPYDHETLHYADALEQLGCGAEVCTALRAAEHEFMIGGPTAKVESELDQVLSEEELILCFAFFHLMRAQRSIRVLALDEQTTARQLEAAAKRFSANAGAKDIPLTCVQMFFCSISACNKRKTPTVQERGLRSFNNTDVALDMRINQPICKPRKTIARSTGPAFLASSASEGRVSARKESAGGSGGGGDAASASESVLGVLVDDDDDDADEDGAEAEADGEPAVDDADVDDFYDGMRPGDATKTLTAALRDYRPRVAQVRTAAQKQLPGAALGTEFPLPPEIEKLRVHVFKAARRDANRFVRRLFELPCESADMMAYPVMGTVVERSLVKEKTEVECYTICPSCGCITVFRTDMWYANGFSCGVCDAKLREDLKRPCCLGCGRLYLCADEDRRKKRKTKQDAVAAAAASAAAQAVSNAAQPVQTGKKAGKIVAKNTGGKRKAQDANASGKNVILTIRASSTEKEDYAISSKRSSNIQRRLCADEWYSYRLVDQDRAELETVYVCGSCNFQRSHWMRKFELYCSVQEFRYLLNNNIVQEEYASRILAIGKHFNSTEPGVGSALVAIEENAKAGGLVRHRGRRTAAELAAAGEVTKKRSNSRRKKAAAAGGEPAAAAAAADPEAASAAAPKAKAPRRPKTARSKIEASMRRLSKQAPADDEAQQP